MTAVTERFESRRLVVSRDGKASTLDLSYTVDGTEDEGVAKRAVVLGSPWIYGSASDPPLLWRQQVSLEYVAPATWVAEVHYDTTGPEPLSAEDSFEFETTGGEQHITQSLSTTSYVPAGEVVADFEGAIGVSDSGVEGVDIVVPVLQMSETHYYSELSTAERLVFTLMTGRVNSSPFREFDAGEVLFLGVSARRENSRPDTPWSVTFRFAVQRARANFDVGSINVAYKAGWDFMSIRYATMEDTAASALVRRPIQVDIHEVYEQGDFSLFNI